MIKIHGIIGSYKDANGKEFKGIELVDVIAQVEAEKENQVHDFEINSVGGLVTVGYAIADYMEQLKKDGKIVNTIGNGVVASIATIPFLAGQKRQLVKGTDFLIHNPYASVQGDAEQLEEYSKSLAVEEKGMAERYSKITGISSTAMDLLMKENKPMPTSRAVELKFATEEIDGTLNSEFKNMQIIAAIKTTPIMDMTKFLQDGKKMLTDLKALAAKISGNIKNLSVTTDDGKALEVEGDTITVGALVTIDGEPTPSATYVLVDGSSFKTDADGKITEIIEAEAVEAKLGDIVYDKEDKEKLLINDKLTLENGDEIVTGSKGQIIEIVPKAKEDDKDKETVDALKAKNVELENTITEMGKTQTELGKQMVAISKMVGSDFKPPARTTIFASRKDKPGSGSGDETKSDDIRENRKSRKDKKDKK